MLLRTGLPIGILAVAWERSSGPPELCFDPQENVPIIVEPPDSGKCNIASGARSLNCRGPGTTSTLVRKAPAGWVLRRVSRRRQHRRRDGPD
eukprot:4564221-Alexandrium_andersonii.AAC.1